MTDPNVIEAIGELTKLAEKIKANQLGIIILLGSFIVLFWFAWALKKDGPIHRHQNNS